MGDLPDISDLLEAEKCLFSSQQKLSEEVKRLEEGRKKLREGIVTVYKTAQVTPEECDHPVIEYQGMGMSYCGCCDKPLS
ncbi:hypothetical protein ACFL3V_00420 [Nanoarchaeota archaeon]